MGVVHGCGAKVFYKVLRSCYLRSVSRWLSTLKGPYWPYNVLLPDALCVPASRVAGVAGEGFDIFAERWFCIQ